MVSLAFVAMLQHGIRVEWLSGLDFYGDCRDRIESGDPESKAIRHYANPAVLAVSDPLPPTGQLTVFQRSMLFRVVDRRYSQMRPTWVTLNVASRNEAMERIGANIIDRLTHEALVVHCDWPSYRRARC